MKLRNLALICLFNLFTATGAFAQNLFPQKMNVCLTTDYCMDCGSPKATCSAFTFDYISYQINRKYNFAGGTGSIMFQVLVDPDGFSCVLSHNDVTNSPLTADLIRSLNTCLWKPAIMNGKAVRASVNVIFNVANGKISGKMQRMTQEEFAELKPAGDPTIYNKQYQYSNPSLKTYDLTVFTKFNSLLPNNMGESCVVDKTDILWYGTAHGLARFDGENFSPVNETNSPLSSAININALAVDKKDNTWICANKTIYMHNSEKGWQLFDSTNLKISGANHIIANPSGEVFFTNNKGLLIVRNDKLILINKQVIPELPSNDVYYAYYDSRQRLWIGTAGGSIMIDKKQNVTVFNRPNTPLNNVSITNVAEDEKGNLYFSLYDYKNPAGDNDEEGIAVLRADGKWSHYNDKNSGMPSNHVNSIWYDKFEHILWIGTHESGLVRFDLKDGWENYHNNNSAVPGFDIYQITQDSKGTIYAATANGMLRVKKK